MATKARTKNYEAIAAKYITTPSEVTARIRILIYSRNKKGKTLFGTTAPNVLIVDPEHGTDPFKRRFEETGAKVWHVDRWEQLDDVLGFLRRGNHSFDWVDLDGMSRVNKMCLTYVKGVREATNLDHKPGMVDRRDFFKSSELMRELIMGFHALPMGVIFSAQERMMTVDSESEGDELEDASVYFVPDLPAAPRGALNSIVSVIGRLYVTKVEMRSKTTKEVTEKNQRRLWIETHPQYDTGYRSDHELPEFIKNPTVPKLVSLLLEGQPS